MRRSQNNKVPAEVIDVARNHRKIYPSDLETTHTPVLQSEELVAGKEIGFTALGEDLIAWRDHDGEPNVVPPPLKTETTTQRGCPGRSIMER